ncbi:MAG: nickel-type superoxide dismutase maturation protease [Chloroflexi bacterium]|nr:nickel-type superoxide dismutase maturation protease [Chloroflexota bacterium]
MAPTLLPGDWLLVDPKALRSASAPRVGELVLHHDPRAPDRLLVKRVAAVEAGRLVVLGDARDASTDSRTFGPIDSPLVIGRPWFRYWPPGRLGRLRSLPAA